MQLLFNLASRRWVRSLEVAVVCLVGLGFYLSVPRRIEGGNSGPRTPAPPAQPRLRGRLDGPAGRS
jgi:hypothetical protein